MEQKKLYVLHAEDKEWLNRLRFYKEEMDFLQSRIEEIVPKYTDKEVLASCEHFSNQLTLQRHAAQKLKHAIKRDEQRVEANIIANPIAVDHRSIGDHLVERHEIDTFERLYHEFKSDLVTFFSKWM